MGTYRFQDLIVWQKAIRLVEMSYGVANSLPPYERYALADQIRRTAVSIPSNIAEGQKRLNRAETVQFSGIALGSAAELETQLILCQNLHDSNVEEALLLLTEVAKMLTALVKGLRSKL